MGKLELDCCRHVRFFDAGGVLKAIEAPREVCSMTTGFNAGLIGFLALASSCAAQAQTQTAIMKPPTAMPGMAATLLQNRASNVMTPPPGSDLRRALMDTIRPPFEDALGAPVEFFVRRLAVMGDWAYASVRPQRPGGRPINWSQTKFAQEVRAGAFDTDASGALMRLRNGRWTLVDHVIGPTEAYWIYWQEKFNLPEHFFTGQ